MRKKQSQSIWGFIVILGLAAGISVSIRRWVIEPYQIPNSAMKPTLLPGDTIFVWKWPFRTQQPQALLHRGDVIVFSTEPKLEEVKKTYWIRRIVGLPGDHVVMRNGQIILNQTLLASKDSHEVKSLDPSRSSKTREVCTSESFPGSTKDFGTCLRPSSPGEFSEQKVPEGTYLVVSDWRSKTDLDHPLLWSLVPQTAIEGKPWTVWLSIDYSQRTALIPSIRWQRLFQKIE